MAARNPDSVTSSQGEFHAARPRGEPFNHPRRKPSPIHPFPHPPPPLQTPHSHPSHQHKPGIQVGNDTAPDFHATTLPPGSAPSTNTFTPNARSEIPSQADNDLSERSHGKESTMTDAADTLGGATSQDMYAGLGHPGQGQTSRELRQGTGKKEAGGGAFASGAPSGNVGVDERVQEGQRGLEKEGGDRAGRRGDKGGEYGGGGMENEVAK